MTLKQYNKIVVNVEHDFMCSVLKFIIKFDIASARKF